MHFAVCASACADRLRRGLRSRGLLWGLVTLGSTLLSASGARAGVFFGDIAGNVDYSGYNVGPSGGLNNAIAEGFTMTQDYSLQSVTLLLSNYSHATGSNLALSIYSNAGNQPGVDLYNLSTDVTAGGSPGAVTFTGSGSFPLVSGQTYWLDLYATDPASANGDTVEWDGAYTTTYGYAVPSGPGATDVGQLRSIGAGNPPQASYGQTSPPRTAFELSGQAPEPGTPGILTVGGAVALIRRRRRSIASAAC